MNKSNLKIEELTNLTISNKVADFEIIEEFIDLSSSSIELINKYNETIKNFRKIYKITSEFLPIYEKLEITESTTNFEHFVSRAIKEIRRDFKNTTYEFKDNVEETIKQLTKCYLFTAFDYNHELLENYLKNNFKSYRETNYKKNIIFLFNAFLDTLKYLEVTYDNKTYNLEEFKNKIVGIVGDLFSKKKQERYVLLSNDVYDILTCSYKLHISSCYNLEEGDYKASMQYILSDNYDRHNLLNWYVAYELNKNDIVNLLDNKDNVIEINNILFRCCLCRRFYTIFNKENSNDYTLCLASNYGCNNTIATSELFEIISKAHKLSNLDLVEQNKRIIKQYSKDRAYSDFRVWNNQYTNNEEELKNLPTLWASCNQFSELYDDDYKKIYCSNCRDEISRDSAIYIDGEYYCEDCCFYCDNCCDWHLNSETHYTLNNQIYCNNCVREIH